MAKLTEEMVIARSKQSDLSAIKKLNCWGAELGDVSLLRRMPNVEVLALSINKIRRLDDFAWCRRLRELYIRKNEVRDLAEIRHLRALPELTALWLGENPCTDHPEYRMTVLRNLPNLEKLDNVAVQREEVLEAARRGELIPDSDDEGYPQLESFAGYQRQRSVESSPEREQTYYRQMDQTSDGSEGATEPPPEPRADTHQSPGSPARRAPHPPPAEPPPAPAPAPAPAMTRSYYDPRQEESSLRHSMSTHSVKEYTYAGERVNGGGSSPRERPATSPHYSETHYDRPERCESYASPRCPLEERGGGGGGGGGGGEAPHYASAVMGERRGFTRRPVTRNSNLLSALLCLVKELDYPSLEVAEMAVRCRMDELASGQ